MSCINVVASVCLLLLPFSISFADDDETQLLHNHTYREFASTDRQYQGDCAIVFPATTHQMTQPRFDVYSIGAPVRSMLCTISGYHS